MGLEENSVAGAGAMDEEVRRQTENELIRHAPELGKNPRLLKMMVEAVGGLRGSALRPSDAVDSQGRIKDSDQGQDEGFFGDMESYRKANMGTGFEDIRSMDPARVRPSEQPTGGMSSGKAFVRKALAGNNSQMPQAQENDSFLGNQDQNDQGEGGGRTVADDRTQPANPNPTFGKQNWIKNYPAPGRGQVLTPVEGGWTSGEGGVSRPVAGGYGDNNVPVETVSRPLTQAQTTRAARRGFYGR